MRKYLLGNKEVKAFEIGRIEANKIYPIEPMLPSVKVSDGFLRSNPLDRPGYYVDYLDGSVGFNPKENFEKIATPAIPINQKTLHNSDVSATKENVPDVVIYGDVDMFQLICKASSKKEGWIKSTKAMHIPGLGCLIQVSTQQGDNVAEALAFIPGGSIFDIDDNNKDKGRKIRKAL